MKSEEHILIIILLMFSFIFCAATMPVKSAQSDVLKSPTADFFAFFTSGNAPHTTEFMDKSTGNPTDWYWEFGDGATSTKRDPVHTYQDPGSYTVILTATNDAGSDVVTKAGYIIVKGSTTNTESAKNTESVKDTETTENIESTENTVQEPVADFFAFSTSGNAPHTTEFMDKSTGNPTDWYWEFGDGATSTKRDPVHTYQDPGSYTVILTATNDAGSDVVTKAGYIIVKGSTTNTESTTTTESVKDTETTENIESTENTVQEPVADFFAFFTSGNAPHTTEFMDKSTGNPTDWYWEFGDGATSTKRDPVHTYQDPGSYTVTLTATNDAGSDEKIKASYIVVKESATNTESTVNTAEKTVAKSSASSKESTKDIESTTNTAEKTVAKSSASSKESTKDTKISASKIVSLSYLQVAAETDPARSQGKTTPGATDSVKIVEAALVEEGYLDDTYAHDGAYGSATINAYKKWQESLGSPAKYCDGVPGKTDLTKLGNKYGFTVDASTVSDFYLYRSEEDTTKLNNADSNKETTPKYTKVTKSNQDSLLKPSSASKVDTSSKVYSEPDVRVVSAKLDSSREYIEVDYYLKSDFYSNSRTGTSFSIGYKFNNPQINRVFENEFVDINQPKGHYVAKIPYPGINFVDKEPMSGIIAKVTIYTHYTTAFGRDGNDHYRAKGITLSTAPTGKPYVSDPHVVDRFDVAKGFVISKATGIGIALYSKIPNVKKLGILLTVFGEYKDIDEKFGLNTAPPDLSVGQIIQTTTWFDDDNGYENIKMWQNQEAFDNHLTPIYDANISWPVP
ncbi:cell surface protein [Methanosarcina barkeri MS]|uniref:Cell surface protein n=1 Tax=Methanosarcina barkeri MS TaxID=1434108 RepID=A0A0E3LN18_METBA|nr:PKD domain-containing protein [Methanosarcina barkeri]AKB53996.1 cell surface protein [Methanosarcina barkeri MS]